MVLDEHEDVRLLARIGVDADVCAGKPRIRGTRIWVCLILGMLAHGKTVEILLEEYPQCTRPTSPRASRSVRCWRTAGRQTFLWAASEPTHVTRGILEA